MHPNPSRHRWSLRLKWVCTLLTLCLGVCQAGRAQRNLEAVPVELRVPGQAPQRLYAESHALIIGASEYRAGWPRLPGVPGDVKAVASLFRAQGFTVTEVRDPTYAQLDAALRNFIAEHGQKPDSRLVIYYAGHGHTLKTSAGSRLGYIVPVDAPNPNAEPGRFRALAYSMESIEALARQIESRHVLFLFDSCFSGTIFRTRSGVPDSISEKTSRPVRQFITAGDEDQPVPDESIFRRQLQLALGDGAADLNHDGYITGTELGVFLEDTVTNYSHRSQTPRWGKIRDPDLDKGDFVFALAPVAVAAPPPPPVLAPPTRPALAVGDSFRDCADCPEMVLVPAGGFEMGSQSGEAGRYDDEGPVHTVRIGYRLAVGKFELSRGEFVRFVQATGYQTDAERGGGCYAGDGKDWRLNAERNWRSPGFTQGETHPVVCVSWNDTQAYLTWLNGRAPGKGYRLLSEAEWEYAARAGRGGTRYPWGDDANTTEQCRYANGADATAKSQVAVVAGRTVANCSDGHVYTAPGGALLPNAFGLYNMHGNAWEWAQDVWHDNYEGAPKDGSAWAAGGDQARRVLRGGSWGNNPRSLRSARRSGDTPDYRYDSTGFRIARTF